MHGVSRCAAAACAAAQVREMACDVPAGGSRPQLQLTMVLHSKDAKQGAPAADGGPVLVWDLAVHPGVLKRAATQPHIKNTLCLMVRAHTGGSKAAAALPGAHSSVDSPPLLLMQAIERVEEVSGMQLLREYKLPHISYKPARGSTKCARRDCCSSAARGFARKP